MNSIRALALGAAGIMLLMTAPAPAASYGQALPDGAAIPLAAALEKPPSEQEQLLLGRITEVCQKQGCWAVLEDQGQSARLMMHEHAFFLPKDYRGQARVYGRLSKHQLSADAVQHLAAESSAPDKVASVEYRVDALGVELIDEQSSSQESKRLVKPGD